VTDITGVDVSPDHAQEDRHAMSTPTAASTVKNVTLEPQDIGDGRLVAPGRTANRVDVESPDVAMKLRTGALIEIPADIEPTAKQRVGHIHTADVVTLDQIEQSETGREDSGRRTVLDAISARRAHLNDNQEPSS